MCVTFDPQNRYLCDDVMRSCAHDTLLYNVGSRKLGTDLLHGERVWSVARGFKNLQGLEFLGIVARAQSTVLWHATIHNTFV